MKGEKVIAIFVIIIALLVGAYYILDPENKTLDDSEREKLGGTYIELSDGFTHYKLTGPVDGKLVVLVHGGTIPIWTWDKQVEALNSAGYRVLTYDKFGRGYSDRPDITYDQELYKRQLLELVDKLELNQKINLVGLSVGGGTVVNFTADYPGRVDKLVLVSPLINNFKLPAIFQIPIIGEFIARLIGVKTIVKRFNNLIEGNPNAEKYKSLFIEQTTYKGFQQSLLSMLRNDAVRDYTKAYQKLAKQDREIMLIWGTNDTEITKEMIKDIRSFLPHLMFKPVEGVGHGIVFQKPEKINSLIIDFL
ncbi:MAG: alpha/beta hydrolase [Bacteroidota bacterium]